MALRKEHLAASMHLDGAADVVSLKGVLLGGVGRGRDLSGSDRVELADDLAVDRAAGEGLAGAVRLALRLAGS